MKKYLKKLKKGIFFEAFELIKKKQKMYFFTLLMDALFVLGIYIVARGGNVAIPFLLGMHPFNALAGALIYALLLILVYSFTKYLALHFVKNMLKKSRLDLSGVKKFYLLNIISIAVWLVILLVLSNIITGGIKDIYLRTTGRIFLSIVSLFIFAFIGIMHSLFALGLGIKDALKKCFKLTFLRLNKYYGVYVVNAAVLGLYFGLNYIIAKALGALFVLDLDSYNLMFVWLGGLLFYLLQAYNRVYFYLIVKRVKK